MPPVPVQLLCFSVGLSFSVPLSWWAYHVGRRTAPRRVVNVDGLVERWAATAPISTVVENPLPPEYTQVKPGQFVRLRWGMLPRENWRALLEGTAASQLSGAGKPFSRAELEATRDLLMARGVAHWRDPAHPHQGWELSRVMVRAIARYLGFALPHPANGNRKPRAGSRVHTRALTKKETK